MVKYIGFLIEKATENVRFWDIIKKFSITMAMMSPFKANHG